MEPFGRESWTLGAQQDRPEVKRLNAVLRWLAVATVLNCALVGAYVSIESFVSSGLKWNKLAVSILVVCFGLYTARYLRKRSLDTNATFLKMKVGSNMSRTERSDHDYYVAAIVAATNLAGLLFVAVAILRSVL
jgi:hypothetical protein